MRLCQHDPKPTLSILSFQHSRWYFVTEDMLSKYFEAKGASWYVRWADWPIVAESSLLRRDSSSCATIRPLGLFEVIELV